MTNIFFEWYTQSVKENTGKKGDEEDRRNGSTSTRKRKLKTAAKKKGSRAT